MEDKKFAIKQVNNQIIEGLIALNSLIMQLGESLNKLQLQKDNLLTDYESVRGTERYYGYKINKDIYVYIWFSPTIIYSYFSDDTDNYESEKIERVRAVHDFPNEPRDHWHLSTLDISDKKNEYYSKPSVEKQMEMISEFIVDSIDKYNKIKKNILCISMAKNVTVIQQNKVKK